jgi:hypothetical protein
MTDEKVPLEDYSLALDEIYALRSMLACEAQVLATKSPLWAREMADRMRHAAAGRVYWAESTAKRSTEDHKAALAAAGAPETLTRDQWEKQVGIHRD